MFIQKFEFLRYFHVIIFYFSISQEKKDSQDNQDNKNPYFSYKIIFDETIISTHF
jgi:hypothetical protein